MTLDEALNRLEFHSLQSALAEREWVDRLVRALRKCREQRDVWISESAWPREEIMKKEDEAELLAILCGEKKE